MSSFLLRRTAQAILTALAVSFIAYALLFLASDPALVLAGPEARQEDIAAARKHFGLDDPLPVQYVRWMGRVLRGDLSESFRTRQPVLVMIRDYFPLTALLAASAFVLATSVAIPLGAWGATRPGTLIDYVAVVTATAGQAIPIFWLGIMLVIFFGVRLGWVPVTGTGTVRHLILPAVTLAIYLIPLALRLTRSSTMEVLSADYVRTARGKGLPPRRVLWKHALRPALIPVVTLVAVQFGTLLGGTIVVESVFAWPGVGTLVVTSILAGDFPVVQGLVLMMSLVFVAVNLAADLVIAVLDPRIRLS